VPNIFETAHRVLKIVSATQSVYDLPININHVKHAVSKLCGGAELSYFFLDIDSAKVRGYFKKGYITKGVYSTDSELVGQVFVSINQDEHWQNFVGVKEALHLLDSETSTAGNQQSVAHLIQDLHTSIDLDGESARNIIRAADRVALVGAVEVLFPYEARLAVREKYEADKLKDFELAKIAAIPDRFVRAAMTDRWFQASAEARKSCNLGELN